MRRPVQILLLSMLAVFATLPSNASNLIMSGLGATGGDEKFLTDSSGLPIASGSLTQAVTFPSLTTEQIATLATGGPEMLLAAATPFGSQVTIGQGTGGTAGNLEVVIEAPLDAPLGGLHLIILNAPTAAAATEILILSISEPVPADDPSGAPGYLAVHLENSTLVFGSTTANGYATISPSGPQPDDFAAWIVAALGESSIPSDRLPEADPDGDGISNLVEYALGSNPSDPASVSRIRIVEDAGTFLLEYLRRTAAGDLSYHPEFSPASDTITWQPVADAPLPLVPAAAPAPAGYEWVRQAIPSGAATGLARIRIGLTAAP